jgi:TRAP-type C4-dicarboxylate transport system permease small subunit
MLHRLARWVATTEDLLLSLLLTAMILLACAQIALRNLADFSFSWADPLLRVMVLWLAMIGALVATRNDHHIRIDLLNRFLPEQLATWVRRASHLFSSLVCGLIAWHAGHFVLLEKADGAVAFNGLAAWWFELILPLGFGLVALRFLLLAITPVKPDKPTP